MDDANIVGQDDLAAIQQTVRDYIEGFYDGDEARMESALHPELAKRIAHLDAVSGRGYLAEMSALALTKLTPRKLIARRQRLSVNRRSSFSMSSTMPPAPG
jgi:hypothetical protein